MAALEAERFVAAQTEHRAESERGAQHRAAAEVG
jgi:hypothetical protein